MPRNRQRENTKNESGTKWISMTTKSIGSGLLWTISETHEFQEKRGYRWLRNKSLWADTFLRSQWLPSQSSGWRNIITLLTTPRHLSLSWAKLKQVTSSLPVSLTYICTIHPSRFRSFKSFFLPSGSTTKILHAYTSYCSIKLVN